jgi:L-alanine-DL-glutamate epimerase-like enolase superfamily enzyme
MITPDDLERGAEPFKKIRDAVGMKIEVALEMHSRWMLTAAKRIARHMEQYEPMWFEDPLRIDNIDELAQFARSTRIPTIASELVAGKYGFRELLEKHAFGYMMLDFGWCGGLTEAKKVAAMADAYHLPINPHDCTGPVALAIGVHFCVSQPNAGLQEVVRAYYHDWYQEIATDLPVLERGYIRPTESPGIGVTLQPDMWKRADAHVRSST